MTPDRFESIARNYQKLRFGIVGDFCLDRYLEIDAARAEVSIETGLPVHNVVRVRPQPGGAGTVLNNLAALGIRTIYPLGFAGEDGEGYELRRALGAIRGVCLDYFAQTPLRQTFTYCKPLLFEAGHLPRELSRLDQKNWSPTPPSVTQPLNVSLREVWPRVDALILLSQVDVPGTGVITEALLQAVRILAKGDPDKLVVADSRHGLSGFPTVTFKMNVSEFSALAGVPATADLAELGNAATAMANGLGRPVVVTLAERGILGAEPGAAYEHVASLPLRGEIDIVGAGDAVTANFGAASAAGASMLEALEIANAAGSIVIHQLGTTGVASVEQLRDLLLR